MAHISEIELENYALNRVSESATAKIEEHLLICENCRKKLVEIEQRLRGFRD